MEKCPILEGHQRKMCKSKVELPEAQALTGLRLPITYGLLPEKGKTEGE